MSTLAHSLIVHHYPLSPYAEKIRSMLGYTGLSWHSVITSEAPPRPMLTPLAGGYRRIPVAQIGADIFCDSRNIAREIATLADRPELSPDNCSDAALDWITRAEGPLFFASVMSAVGLPFLVKGLFQVSFKGLRTIQKDRASLSSSPDLKIPKRAEAKDMVLAHLGYMEEQLSSEFLLGDYPQLADFAVYHGLWMMHVQGRKSFIKRYPKTRAWIERMRAFGHGSPVKTKPEAALQVAKQAEPRAIASEYQQDAMIGQRVSVGPTDYCLETTSGTLVGRSEQTLIIARESPEAGLVHVHFPSAGYEICAQ